MAGLWTAFAIALSAQNDIAQAGYPFPDPLEVAPNQIVIITTRGIGALNPATNVVSRPEIELGGVRVYLKQAHSGPLNVTYSVYGSTIVRPPGRIATRSRVLRWSCRSK